MLEGNKVKFVEVTTGITGEADIEVTSGVKIRHGNRARTKPGLEDAQRRHDRKAQERKPGANANANEGS